MPSTGSGTMTVTASGGAGGALAIAAPIPYTFLSLHRYAQIVGINPVHFSQAKGSTYFPEIADCDDIFWQYDWQHQRNVGRRTIAKAIKEAENELASVLGFQVAPMWIEDEVHTYPQHHRPDVIQTNMLDVAGRAKSFKAKWGKFIQGGRRATAAVQAGATVTYSDDDGDGFSETATVSATTTLTDKCEIKVYFAGKGGEQDWEIRPARTVTLSGGTVTFTFWAWQLIDPDLWEAPPTATGLGGGPGVAKIDIEASASFVATVDVYREYNDFTEASAQLFWEPGPNVSHRGLTGFCLECNTVGGNGCPACSFTTQDGCIHVRDTDTGLVVPAAAEYDSDDARWEHVSLSVCREPDQVKIWYYAGDQSQDYFSDKTCDPLSQYWAETIAWLATARIPRPLCGCNNTMTMTDEWQRDLSFTGSRELGSYQVSPGDLSNPFGTRLGEVRAWRRVNRMQSAVNLGVAV